MTSQCPTCHDICQVLMIVLIPTEGAVHMSTGWSASHWFLLTHLNVTSYNSGCKDGHITDKVWMLEKKNLKNDSKCGIYDPIFQFKGSTFNIPGEYHGVQGLQHQQRQFSTKHPNYAAVFSSSEREKKPGNFVSAWLPSRIFFSQRRWLFKNQQRIQLHVLCVFAVCVCVSSSLIASIQDKATWLTSCFTEFCCSCILLINVEAFSFVEHISCSWSS